MDPRREGKRNKEGEKEVFLMTRNVKEAQTGC